MAANAFYESEFLDLLTQLLCRFQDAIDSRAYLEDLILCVHCVMRLLSSMAKSSEALFVARRVRNRKKGS